MRILIISDVHGNLPALEFVLKKEKEVDLVVSLGDVVNYGPWSNECVDLLDSLKNKVLLLGNHETAFIAGIYPGTNAIAKAFFNFCYPTFTKQNSISSYVEKYEYFDYDFVHTLNDMYIFPDTEIRLNKSTFIGHSHRLFSKTINQYKLVNVGSVGQNRSNIDELNYVLWEPKINKLQLMTCSFSADYLIKEMYNRNYPKACIQYIESKRK